VRALEDLPPIEGGNLLPERANANNNVGVVENDNN
jgi:hypothetical protein